MIIAGLIAIFLLAVINATPLAFFAMLFLGNLGLHFSFLAMLPGAVALKFYSNNMLQAPTTLPQTASK